MKNCKGINKLIVVNFKYGGLKTAMAIKKIKNQQSTWQNYQKIFIWETKYKYEKRKAKTFNENTKKK